MKVDYAYANYDKRAISEILTLSCYLKHFVVLPYMVLYFHTNGIAFLGFRDFLMLYLHGIYLLLEVSGCPFDMDCIANFQAAFGNIDHAYSNLAEVMFHSTNLFFWHETTPIRALGWFHARRRDWCCGTLLQQDWSKRGQYCQRQPESWRYNPYQRGNH